ncbi:unnamed protein product, partial [marine sediment metagenome]
IKGEQNNIECTDDIIRLTDRVELVQGDAAISLSVYITQSFR